MGKALLLIVSIQFFQIYSISGHFKKFLILLVFISIQIAYSQTPIDTSEYYPLQIGNYWEYWSYGYSFNRLITGDTLMPNGRNYKTIREEMSDAPGYYWYWYQRNEGDKTYQYFRDSNMCQDREFIYFDFSLPDSIIWPICYIFQGSGYRSCTITKNYYSSIFNKTLETKSMVAVKVIGIDTIYEPIGGIRKEFIGKNIGLFEMVDEAAGVFFLQGAILNGQKYGTIVGIKDTKPKITGNTSIQLKVYPNPFNNSTQIYFSLPGPSNLQLKLFNIIGEEIYEITHGEYNAGEHQIYFNSSRIASGFYILTLMTDNQILSKKIIILK